MYNDVKQKTEHVKLASVSGLACCVNCNVVVFFGSVGQLLSDMYVKENKYFDTLTQGDVEYVNQDHIIYI